MNWRQIGDDFNQKYKDCYCWYESPYSKERDIFRILNVEVYDRKAPDITLFNDVTGELYLTYKTDAELDFSFPETGYFQSGKQALLFVRKYARQWKKGVSEDTAGVESPYDQIYPVTRPHIDGNIVRDAFKKDFAFSFNNAIKKLDTGKFVSVALDSKMALGLSRSRKAPFWLWFDHEPIAEVDISTVQMKVPAFEQEVQDFLKRTGDYARTVI